MVDRRCIADVEEQARVGLVGILVRHAFVSEDSDLEEGSRSVKSSQYATEKKESKGNYLQGALRAESLLMLDQHPRHRRSDLGSQQSLPARFIHAELGAGPQRDVLLVVVLVLQNLEHGRPGSWVFDVEEQDVF